LRGGTTKQSNQSKEIIVIKSKFCYSKFLRNPIIVEVFDGLGGYIEKLGTGIRRMIEAMKELKVDW